MEAPCGQRSRPIMDAPSRIDDLAVGVDHVVYVADGVVGVAPRRDEARPTWITADAAAPRPIHVDGTAGRVALFCLTPSLERWTLYPGHESRRRKPLHREVIDPAPAHYARTSGAGTDAPRSVWTTGDGAIDAESGFRDPILLSKPFDFEGVKTVLSKLLASTTG